MKDILKFIAKYFVIILTVLAFLVGCTSLFLMIKWRDGKQEIEEVPIPEVDVTPAVSIEQSQNNNVVNVVNNLNFYTQEGNNIIGKKIEQAEDFEDFDGEFYELEKSKSSENLKAIYELGRKAYKDKSYGNATICFNYLLKNDVKGLYRDLTLDGFKLCSELFEETERFEFLIENDVIRGVVSERGVRQREQPYLLDEFIIRKFDLHEDLNIIKRSSFKQKIGNCHTFWYFVKSNKTETYGWIYGQYIYFYPTISQAGMVRAFTPLAVFALPNHSSLLISSEIAPSSVTTLPYTSRGL